MLLSAMHNMHTYVVNYHVSMHRHLPHLSVIILPGCMLIGWCTIAAMPLIMPLLGSKAHAANAVTQHSVGTICQHSLITTASAPKTTPASAPPPSTAPLVLMPEALAGLHIGFCDSWGIQNGPREQLRKMLLGGLRVPVA